MGRLEFNKTTYMKHQEVCQLLRDVRADYVAMARELNKHKRMVHPVDPLSLPLVGRMDRAVRELASEGPDSGGSVEVAPCDRPTKA